jgi:ribonuclease VapC
VTSSELVLDTSALVAILLDEPERDVFVQAVSNADHVLVSACTLVEARMVLHGRKGELMNLVLHDFLDQNHIDVVAVDMAQADAAHHAFLLYGKGSGHPAQLNFGDLFSYALARTRRLPLLYKGRDFAATDVASALDNLP